MRAYPAIGHFVHLDGAVVTSDSKHLPGRVKGDTIGRVGAAVDAHHGRSLAHIPQLHCAVRVT